MKKLFTYTTIAIGMALTSLAGAQAQTFQLLNHGGGNLGPDYGLRLDVITGGPNTYSVSTNGADVTLSYSASAEKAVISGVVYQNSTGELYNLSYTIFNAVQQLDGGFKASNAPASSTGYITNVNDATDTFHFQGQPNSGSNPYFALFAFDGHRFDNTNLNPLDDGPSDGGVFRGWVNPIGDTNRGATNDFLVRVAIVPEPATWLMMIVGFALTGLAAKRRRVTKLA